MPRKHWRGASLRACSCTIRHDTSPGAIRHGPFREPGMLLSSDEVQLTVGLRMEFSQVRLLCSRVTSLLTRFLICFRGKPGVIYFKVAREIMDWAITGGWNVEIRQITEDDAAAFLALQLQLDRETDFMLMAPGERQTTARQQRDIIRKILSDGRSMTWVIADDRHLVGGLTLRAMAPFKIRHTGHIVVGLLASHRGQGLGSKLFGQMETWARVHAFHRLELTVMCDNRAALNLYLTQGFMVEGLRRDSIRQPDGHWVDEYAMSKLL